MNKLLSERLHTMLITGKALGSKKRLFEDWSIPIPPDDEGGDGGLKLGQLIARIVRVEVRSFQQRQHDRQFLRALTASEIEEAAARGKIEMGASEIGIQDVDAEQSVAVALQAFEDGLYLVVIDDIEYRDLEQPVYLKDDSRITFIRLTMLTGG
jgi:hypothetical protein